jgi:hypothetical protein
MKCNESSTFDKSKESGVCQLNVQIVLRKMLGKQTDVVFTLNEKF